MKTLQDHLEAYLALRQALGYKLRTHRSSLKNFVKFIAERRATTITTQLALTWAMKPDNANPKWWAYKLRMVHHFALYVRAREHATEVPPLTLLPYNQKRPKPYIYSEEEISHIIAEAKALPCRTGLRGLTYFTLFSLIWVTGLRISEALGLDNKDVNCTEHLLTIRNAKFGKSRLIPVHTSASNALAEYACRRNQTLPFVQSTSFFLDSVGNRPNTATAQRIFRQLCTKIGIRDVKNGK